MGNERARQKKLAKRKKKRADANRRAKTPAERTVQSAELGRKAASWGFDAAYLSVDWDDPGDPALVSGALVRQGIAGDLAMGVFLADRTCLGIKSGWVRRVDRPTLAVMLDRVGRAHGGLVPVDLLTLQSVAFHAADYARALGFAGDSDFPLGFLGERPETLRDTPFARVAKPFYFAGPRDNAPAIIAQLVERVGAGNFDYIAPLGGPGGFDDFDAMDDEEDDDDEGDGTPSLPG